MSYNLKNKKILLGVTGSIAAYKSPLIVRELIKAGAHVNVIMTNAAENFVTRTVLSNLSRNPVVKEMFEASNQDSGAWHIQLAHWCDIMAIAPCSATTLGRIANGICDSALATVTIALPKETPLIIFPAMDSTMWVHPATQRNINIVKQDGAVIVPPEDGELSSGLSGPGRLPEIMTIIEKIAENMNITDEKTGDSIIININNDAVITDKIIEEAVYKPVQTLDDIVEKDKWNAELELEKLKLLKELGSLKNKKVLITAGPTIEKIDDVRFISNHSSGKMGYAIAKAAENAGARVTLVSGPVNQEGTPGIKLINVTSADEMFDAVLEEFPDTDIAILAAAVSDYTPVNPIKGKMKKSSIGDFLTLELQTTNDILATLGIEKTEDQLLVGFALESENEIDNAEKKLREKNCDIIVLNYANRENSGFGGDNNTITILDNKGNITDFNAMSKDECAIIILKNISTFIKNQS